jgi:hypothetical protein
LIDDAAYQAPKPARAKTEEKVIRMILRVLLIADSFYIVLIEMVSPLAISGINPIYPILKLSGTCSNIYQYASTLTAKEG